MKYLILLMAIALGLFFPLKAQELLCNVVVDANQLVTDQSSEKSLFEDLEKAILNFMNNQKWTDDEFKKGEQIECNLVITLTESPSQNIFRATAQFQAIRPVYNTNYSSSLISFIDRDFNFTYTQGQPLIFAPTTYTSNLTSILAFYANVILAMDYDSFSELGGSPYVEQAFDIVNIAQSSGQSGWRRNQGNRNRFWLAENLISQQMLELRKAVYRYHRLGLDTFLLNAEKSRNEIVEALKAIRAANNLKPSAVLTNVFFDTKNKELVNIFKEAPSEQQKEVREILIRLDPGNTERYNLLDKGS